jgi:4-hydroxyphenylpyruvate dioxygenase
LLNTALIQKVGRTDDNKTGMIMNISQTPDKENIFVMSESESHTTSSRVQQSIEKFGPGIHHIAFSTDDIIGTIKELRSRSVDLVTFPAAYYDLLRSNKELEGVDIDSLQEQGILIDKEGDSYLLQKFLKPMGDRPYFFYEIIQRVNGYNGFALNNIAVLRKAEEIQITQVASA